MARIILKHPSDAVLSVCMAPDGKNIMSGCSDKAIQNVQVMIRKKKKTQNEKGNNNKPNQKNIK